VLVFHRVSPSPDIFWPPLTVQAFDNILSILKRHYTVYSLDELFTLTSDQLKNACFITFDDAFEDTYHWARPLLIKHEVTATFFVPTQAVQTKTVIWPLFIRNSLVHTRSQQIKKQSHLPFNLFLRSVAEKKYAFDVILKYLQGLQENEFEISLASLLEQLGTYQDNDIRVMSVDQIRDLSESFSIQSHTQSHLFLSSLSLERVDQEFVNSIQDLRVIIPGKSVYQLAYPVGDYTNEAVTAASKYFEAAFRVGDELVESAQLVDREYRMKIPRFNMHMQSQYEVYAYINGFHGFVKRLLKVFTAN
jgi:peptidoglycan/xylan/chitin deacetylase (PgdA/CDA1 family)